MPEPLPRPPVARPARFPGARRLALGALLAVLAVATGVLVTRGAHGTAEAGPPASAGAPPTTRLTTTTAAHPFDAILGNTTGCQTLTAVEPQLLCALPGGIVTYTQVTDVLASYRRHVDNAARGTTAAGACATGLPEERAWSRPSSPQLAAGRFECRVDTTAAEMWWTIDDAGVLAHAVRRDGDLATLFSWWRAHDEHP